MEAPENINLSDESEALVNMSQEAHGPKWENEKIEGVDNDNDEQYITSN